MNYPLRNKFSGTAPVVAKKRAFPTRPKLGTTEVATRRTRKPPLPRLRVFEVTDADVQEASELEELVDREQDDIGFDYPIEDFLSVISDDESDISDHTQVPYGECSDGDETVGNETFASAVLDNSDALDLGNESTNEACASATATAPVSKNSTQNHEAPANQSNIPASGIPETSAYPVIFERTARGQRDASSPSIDLFNHANHPSSPSPVSTKAVVEKTSRTTSESAVISRQVSPIDEVAPALVVQTSAFALMNRQPAAMSLLNDQPDIREQADEMGANERLPMPTPATTEPRMMNDVDRKKIECIDSTNDHARMSREADDPVTPAIEVFSEGNSALNGSADKTDPATRSQSLTAPVIGKTEDNVLPEGAVPPGYDSGTTKATPITAPIAPIDNDVDSESFNDEDAAPARRAARRPLSAPVGASVWKSEDTPRPSVSTPVATDSTATWADASLTPPPAPPAPTTSDPETTATTGSATAPRALSETQVTGTSESAPWQGSPDPVTTSEKSLSVIDAANEGLEPKPRTKGRYSMAINQGAADALRKRQSATGDDDRNAIDNHTRREEEISPIGDGVTLPRNDTVDNLTAGARTESVVPAEQQADNERSVIALKEVSSAPIPSIPDPIRDAIPEPLQSGESLNRLMHADAQTGTYTVFLPRLDTPAESKPLQRDPVLMSLAIFSVLFFITAFAGFFMARGDDVDRWVTSGVASLKAQASELTNNLQTLNPLKDQGSAATPEPDHQSVIRPAAPQAAVVDASDAQPNTASNQAPVQGDAVITGTLMSSNGEPVAAEQVVLESASLGARFTTITRDDGEFTLENLMPGDDYLLSILPSGPYQELNVYDVVISDTNDHLPLTLEAMPTANLSGRIVDAENNAIPNFQLWATGFDQPGQQINFRSDHDGNYRLFGLPTGKLSFSSKSDPKILITSVLLNSGEDAVVDLVVDFGTHEIGGVATDGGGNPLSGVEITLEWSVKRGEVRSMGTRTTSSGPDGTFRFSQLGPGKHFLTARAEGLPLIRRSIDVGIDDTEIALSLGANAAQVD